MEEENLKRQLKKARLYTAIPLGVVFIVAVIFGLMSIGEPPGGEMTALDVSLNVGMGAWGLAVVTAIVFYFRGKKDIAKTIGKVAAGGGSGNMHLKQAVSPGIMVLTIPSSA